MQSGDAISLLVSLDRQPLDPLRLLATTPTCHNMEGTLTASNSLCSVRLPATNIQNIKSGMTQNHLVQRLKKGTAGLEHTFPNTLRGSLLEIEQHARAIILVI